MDDDTTEEIKAPLELILPDAVICEVVVRSPIILTTGEGIAVFPNWMSLDATVPTLKLLKRPIPIELRFSRGDTVPIICPVDGVIPSLRPPPYPIELAEN